MPRKTTAHGDSNGTGTEAGFPASRDARERIKADHALQQEISDALEDLADSLPTVSDLRLARVLSTLVVPSWSEHVSFQSEVLFPILMRLTGGAGDTRIMLDRFQAEHDAIADRHAEIAHEIDALLGRRLSNTDMFGYLLRSVFDLRRRHMTDEVKLADMLPPLLSPADVSVLNAWEANRPRPPFPVHLMLNRR